MVPLSSNQVERALSFVQPLRLEPPETLPPPPMGSNQARARQHPEMLGNGLTADPGAVRQSADGRRAAARQPGDQTEPGLVSQRGKYRGRIPKPSSGWQGIE
ncbi:MAG TPA: hypothetical protein VKB22_12645 [Gemmatimonadales bacterium]|nr:hypothetical protein [Gemmatimonadales bacterium]